MDDSLPFPTEFGGPPQEFAETYVLWEHTLPRDPSLHFAVAVSRDWRVLDAPAAAPTPESPLATVARLRRGAAPEAEMEVVAAHVPREIDPADWLLIHLREHQWRVLDMRRSPSPTGEAGDALSSVNVKGQGFVARTLAVKDGARVYALHCQTGRHSYAGLAEEFLAAVTTFRLLNPTGERFAEPLKTYRADAPLECAFAFPASWPEVPDPSPPPGGAAFSLVNLRGAEWAGQFTFAAVARYHETSYAGLFANYLGQLRENGIEVEADALTPRPAPPFAGMWSGVFAASRDGDSLEVRCAVLEHARAWLLFSLVGPDWEIDPEANAINRRAFRMSLETLDAK